MNSVHSLNNIALCGQRRLLLEKNVLVDDGMTSSAARNGSKQSRWPSLLSLFNTSATWKPSHQVHRAQLNRDLSTSRQFRSEVNVSAAVDRNQYGCPVMTSPKVEGGRPTSALSRPGLVAVNIPLMEDTSTQAASTTNVVDKGDY